MNIKNKVKYSFILITLLVLVIFCANTIVLYQINENEISNNKINKLVSLQENMANLIKDILVTSKQNELLEKENSFISYEKKFEEIRNLLTNDSKKDFIDYLLNDLHQNKEVLNDILTLGKNEKKIEEAFEKIFLIQYEKIKLIKLFDEKYPLENKLRNKIEHEVIQINDFYLLKEFSDLKYYSKEVLFQKQEANYLQKWLEKIENINNKIELSLVNEYRKTVETIGNYSISLKKLSLESQEYQNTIYSLLQNNKNINEQIQNNINELSENFIKKIKLLTTFILIITIIFITYLSTKVNKNVALSVDEIEAKVQDGLSKIKTLNKEIEDTQKEVIFTMGAIGESRSKETGNHVKRVAQYSKLLALYYGINPKEAEMLKQASPMHDIGKVAIPDNILNKPGKFDEHEREIMNTHAQIGYEMLKHSNRPLLQMAATISKQHHEKWDGSGYPEGLKGEEIHIYGRITALADVFDALGSHRCYKKAWDDEKIFNLFKEERGKHFDPKLVDIFFEHLDEFLAIRDKFKDTIKL